MLPQTFFSEMRKLALGSLVPKGGIARHETGPSGKARSRNFASYDEIYAQYRGAKDPVLKARLRKKLDALDNEPL